MKKYNIIIGLVLTFVLGTVLGKFALSGPQSAIANSIQADHAVKKQSQAATDKIIVSVNGRDIMQSQVQKRLSPVAVNLAKQQQTRFAKAKNDITQQMVVEQLVKEAIEASSIEVTDEQVEQKLAETANGQNLTAEEFLKEAQEKGIAAADIKKQLRDNIVFAKLVESEYGADKFVVSEEEAKKYYDDNPDKFFQPLKIRASHILFGTGKRDASGNPVAIDKKQDKEFKAKADKILEQVRKGGDFAELAKANSACATRENGGDLGYFGKDDNIDPNFFKAALALEVGQVSDVIKTQFGYHIIKVTERIDENTISFDNTKDAIMNWLSGQKRLPFSKEYISTLVSNADIAWTQNK